MKTAVVIYTKLYYIMESLERLQTARLINV